VSSFIQNIVIEVIVEHLLCVNQRLYVMKQWMTGVLYRCSRQSLMKLATVSGVNVYELVFLHRVQICVLIKYNVK